MRSWYWSREPMGTFFFLFLFLLSLYKMLFLFNVILSGCYVSKIRKNMTVWLCITCIFINNVRHSCPYSSFLFVWLSLLIKLKNKRHVEFFLNFLKYKQKRHVIFVVGYRLIHQCFFRESFKIIIVFLPKSNLVLVVLKSLKCLYIF